MPQSSIPLTKMSSSKTHHPLSEDDEEEGQGEEEHGTLLTHPSPLPPQSQHSSRLRLAGAIWQIVSFTAIGLLIALASGAFAYSLRGRLRGDDSQDFIHVPLPGMRDPHLLKYFGGMGPYIGGEYVPPSDGCEVTQVHMIARHGERYPTLSMGLQIAMFAQNISRSRGGFKGSLSFLNDWSLESDGWLYAPGDQLDQETLTGPAAGSLTMFRLGEEFRSRYPLLWNFEKMGNGLGVPRWNGTSRANVSEELFNNTREDPVVESAVRVWASDSERVVHSAKYFSMAFFGILANVSVEVIPETKARWGDSLTTTDSCPAFSGGEYNVSYGYRVAANTYFRTFIPQIVDRMNSLSSDYKFTDKDILAMSNICPFQVNALGYSPFCDIFTGNEWRDFNYARDLATYYGSGPGNPFGQAMGQPWVNAVINLMKQPTSTNQNIYFSFSHDTDIVTIIPALGIFPAPNTSPPLPWDKYDGNRVFWTTSIVPMGGHIVIERLQCPGTQQQQVRVVVNERVQSVPGCEGGVDGMCALEEFERVVTGRWTGGGFCEVCAPGNETCVDGISFYE